MNLPQAEAERNPAGTAAFCGRTRIIGNTDINNPEKHGATYAAVKCDSHYTITRRTAKAFPPVDQRPLGKPLPEHAGVPRQGDQAASARKCRLRAGFY
jgi:hypothetical protein